MPFSDDCMGQWKPPSNNAIIPLKLGLVCCFVIGCKKCKIVSYFVYGPTSVLQKKFRWSHLPYHLSN